MLIKANGIQMNYELSGKAGAPVVMLSHSLGSSMAMWEPQLAPLEADYRVLRYDTRGHGGSDAPEGPYTFELLGTDVAALLDALNIDKVHWVGLSMGGMIGQNVALQHADRLQSLALCDTAAVMPEEVQPIWQERIDTVRKNGMGALVQQTLERWFRPPFLSQNPPAVDLIKQHFLNTPVEGFIGCSEAIRKLNCLDQLRAVQTPTLIIVGKDDPGTPVAASEVMHDAIPNSRLVVIPDAAHLSNIEQADAFNRSLLDFLLSL